MFVLCYEKGRGIRGGTIQRLISVALFPDLSRSTISLPVRAARTAASPNQNGASAGLSLQGEVAPPAHVAPKVVRRRNDWMHSARCDPIGSLLDAQYKV